MRCHRCGTPMTLGRPIAPGMFALHTCDNRRCVNPDHLYEGTAGQNARDRAARGRTRNGYLVARLGTVSREGNVA